MKIIDRRNCDASESDETAAGSSREGFTTYEETSGPLLKAVRDYLIQDATPEDARYGLLYKYERQIDAAIAEQPLLLTVHECWSGYSEYTVTNQWQELTLKWGDIEKHFEGMAEFFRALADVSDDVRNH